MKRPITKEMRAKLETFKPGDRVRIINANFHKDLIGETGTVVNTVKCRAAVSIERDHNGNPCFTPYPDMAYRYEAWVENVEKISD